MQWTDHALFLSEPAALGPLFPVCDTDRSTGFLLLSSPPFPVSLFAVAGADVQTLRERLIDALESHSDTWPPACPPLEPARYWGLGQACAAWAAVTGLEASGRWGQQGRGPRLGLPVAFEADISVGQRPSSYWRAYAGALSSWG